MKDENTSDSVPLDITLPKYRLNIIINTTTTTTTIYTTNNNYNNHHQLLFLIFKQHVYLAFKPSAVGAPRFIGSLPL